MFRYLALMLLLSFPALQASQLLIVHPSYVWDPDASAKTGIEQMIEKHLNLGSEIYYLKKSSPLHKGGESIADTYYIKEQQSFSMVDSQGGEHSIVADSEVTVVGGYHYSCLNRAVGNLVKYWQKYPGYQQEILTINLFTPGIYEGDDNGGILAFNQCDDRRSFFNDFYDYFDINDSLGGVGEYDYDASLGHENDNYNYTDLSYIHNHHLSLRCNGVEVATFGIEGKPQIVINQITSN